MCPILGMWQIRTGTTGFGICRIVIPASPPGVYPRGRVLGWGSQDQELDGNMKTQGLRQVQAARFVIPYVLCGCLYCLRCCSVLRGSLPALIYSGGQGYMESPCQVLFESNYNLIR